MRLKDYLTEITPDARAILADACNTTVGHLLNCGYGQRQPNPALCVSIEKNTKGLVSRRELRADWRQIWPEITSAGKRRAVR
jgi:hypothetical protein